MASSPPRLRLLHLHDKCKAKMAERIQERSARPEAAVRSVALANSSQCHQSRRTRAHHGTPGPKCEMAPRSPRSRTKPMKGTGWCATASGPIPAGLPRRRRRPSPASSMLERPSGPGQSPRGRAVRAPPEARAPPAHPHGPAPAGAPRLPHQQLFSIAIWKP